MARTPEIPWRQFGAFLAIVIAGAMIARYRAPIFEWMERGSGLLTSKGDAVGGVPQRRAAEVEMTLILRLLRYHMADGRKPPDDLRTFVRENTEPVAGREHGLDPFGNVYVLRREGESRLALISPGPDHRLATSDDIVVR